MSEKKTHPRHQFPNTLYLTPNLPHFTSPTFLGFSNRNNSFFNIINNFIYSFPAYQLSSLSLSLSLSRREQEMDTYLSPSKVVCN
jgi:hypothetical protein